MKFVILCLSLFMSTLTLAADKPLKIGMVTDVGGIHDQSFNQSAWEGLTRAKNELGIKVSYQESKQDSDYDSNLENLLDSENDLIWGIGFKMADSIAKMAKRNPKQRYAIIDYSYGDKTPPNVIGVLFRAEEGAFLAGYIAGKMTKTNTVGFVGGMNVPIIHAFQYGFKAGYKMANPKGKILEQIAESFTDAAKGKAIANQMIGQGADVVFHAAGSVGDGVIEACKEKKKMAVGVDRDQNYLAPQTVITSALKRVDNAIYNVAADLKKGTFKGGTTVFYGLADGGVDVAPTTSKHVPANIMKEVDGIKAKIKKGELKPPADAQNYAKFEKTLK